MDGNCVLELLTQTGGTKDTRLYSTNQINLLSLMKGL